MSEYLLRVLVLDGGVWDDVRGSTVKLRTRVVFPKLVVLNNGQQSHNLEVGYGIPG